MLGALALIVVIAINGIAGDIDDNEVQYDTQMFQGVKVYKNDANCIMLGGLCVHERDCLKATWKRGLCPSSQHLGVECCYELPVRPAPCQQHLGECMDRCPRQLVRPGTDCQNGKFCCVLV